MIGKKIEKYDGVLYSEKETRSINLPKNELPKQENYLSSDTNEAKVMIATSLALLVGLIHVNLTPLFLPIG